MHLQPPPKMEKPKPVEGEEPPAEQPPAEEEGKLKKVFNIYEYQWSQPTSHKNLSQWFFKLKKKIIQVIYLIIIAHK